MCLKIIIVHKVSVHLLYNVFCAKMTQWPINKHLTKTGVLRMKFEKVSTAGLLQ